MDGNNTTEARKMICPKCGAKFPNPIAQAGGRAKVPKGFADPRVMRKALATRRRNKKTS